MKFKKTRFQNLFIFEPNIFSDFRGTFSEIYNKEKLSNYLGNIDFVQTNKSCSKKHVIRGLHFQRPPHAQSKLVSCVKGEILDVAVDLRKNSKTFGQYFL